MSLYQFMVTESPGYSNVVPRKKVMLVCSPLPPEPNLSWEEEVSLVSLEMCQYGVCVRENGFPCAQRISTSEEASSAIRGEVQSCLLMPSLKQSPMTNSPHTQQVTDALKLLGWFWELVSPNCHQCWQGPYQTVTVSTPAATKLSVPSQKSACNFCKYFSTIASCRPIITQ